MPHVRGSRHTLQGSKDNLPQERIVGRVQLPHQVVPPDEHGCDDDATEEDDPRCTRPRELVDKELNLPPRLPEEELREGRIQDVRVAAEAVLFAGCLFTPTLVHPVDLCLPALL